MARKLICDVCKKETNSITGKLFYTPSLSGKVHSNYTHHLDVGICCRDKLLNLFNFSRRTTAEEYHQRRRAVAG